MPILDLQRRMYQIGRIRIGAQIANSNGKGKHPAKLQSFRLTSQDEVAIRAAGGLFGGTPQKWADAPIGDQWELFTETDSIPIVVPPAITAFSQWYETWSGGGCTRRCDGQTEILTQTPCICATEDERTCTPHSRLNVILRDLPGLGVWRLDTSGWNAATELAGTVEVCVAAATRGQLLPAVLRLEQRVIKRPGEPVKKFAVPVLDIQLTPSALGLVVGQAALPAPEPAALEPNGNWRAIDAPDTLELGVGQIGAAIKDAENPSPANRRRNSPPELPPTGLKPRGAAKPTTVNTDTEVAHIAATDIEGGTTTPAQIKKMMAGFNDIGVKSRADRLGFIAAAARPVETSQELTVDEASHVIDTITRVAKGTLTIIFADGTIQGLKPADDDQPLLPDEVGP
ncbi:MAG: hypothetical protein ABI862_14295 [Ilumatobacteraceae bacterium]